MRVACLQLAATPDESKTDRVERVAERVRGLDYADLVVLPEIWNVGYFAFDRYAADAEPVDGPTRRALAEIARERGCHLHGGSIVERDGDRLYNTSLLFDPAGELIHTYRKYHVFGYRSREAELLAPGQDVGVAKTPLGTVGMTTCYDLRFPELYRLMVDDGAELVIVPAAWPAARLEHWLLFTRVRAVENQVHLIGCNTAGEQAGTVLGGHSLVIDPWGEVLAGTGDGEEVLWADLDPDRVAEVRDEFPVLEDRRLYSRGGGS